MAIFNFNTIEKFTRYINESIPKIVHDLTYDLDLKIKNALKRQISCLNFVNRDEFDIQMQIVCKTQEKIEDLEKRLKKLESINKLDHIDNNNHNNTQIIYD